MTKIAYPFFLFLICIAYSCASFNRAHRWNRQIEGRWIATAKYPAAYPKIQFSSLGALFQESNDSISIFSCKIKNNMLLLKGEHKVYRDNRILKLTKDSLIFQTLLGSATPQVYIRKK